VARLRKFYKAGHHQPTFVETTVGVGRSLPKIKLPIFVGEYVWRYNHRNLSLKEQENKLFKLYFTN